jgi:hypothetical protein
MVTFTAQDAAGAGINVNDPAPAIGRNHLEPVDPLVPGANEVDRDDLTGGLGADNGHDVGEALDLAALMEIARPIVVIIVILCPDDQRRGQHERGHPQSRQAYQSGFHGSELSHAEAVKTLSVIVSRRQAQGLYQGHRAR